jgi:hypothetical protein
VQPHIIPDFMLSTSEDSFETGKKGQKQPSLPLSDFNTAPEIHCKQKGNVLKPEGLSA